jgi:nucleotide-binding universal stress UspA family protein
MYTRILVPLDGSPFAEEALPLALELGGTSGASVHLVTVLDPIPPLGDDNWRAQTRDWLTGYLEEVGGRARRTGVEVTTALRFGDVVATLRLEVEDEGADLIVMTTHGRGAVARAWIGSVASELSREGTTPLILVRPRGHTHGSPPETNPRTILIPLDGSEFSESALERAVELGQAFGSAYHLTRIVHYPMDVHSPYVPFTVQMNRGALAEAKRAAADYLEQHASRLRWRGLKVTTSVAVAGQPAHGILAEVDAVGCDMVAMATHGHAGLRVVLGSAADKVLHGARVPLMLIRPIEVPAATV